MTGPYPGLRGGGVQPTVKERNKRLSFLTLTVTMVNFTFHVIPSCFLLLFVASSFLKSHYKIVMRGSGYTLKVAEEKIWGLI